MELGYFQDLRIIRTGCYLNLVACGLKLRESLGAGKQPSSEAPAAKSDRKYSVYTSHLSRDCGSQYKGSKNQTGLVTDCTCCTLHPIPCDSNIATTSSMRIPVMDIGQKNGMCANGAAEDDRWQLRDFGETALILQSVAICCTLHRIPCDNNIATTGSMLTYR